MSTGYLVLAALHVGAALTYFVIAVTHTVS